MKTPVNLFARAITERELQKAVIAMAKRFGWLAFHPLPAQFKDGRYATPTQGDPGFPDCVLSRNGRVLFVELKREGANLEPAQAAWMGSLAASRAEVHLWRPSDWVSGRIEAVLR